MRTYELNFQDPDGVQMFQITEQENFAAAFAEAKAQESEWGRIILIAECEPRAGFSGVAGALGIKNLSDV